MTVKTAPPRAPAIDDVDRDSLKTLPLAMIPLATTGLRRARMIKNARYESVVELFKDKKAGSGQMPVNQLPTAFPQIAESDMEALGKLEQLASYDIYSLRIVLRQIDVPVNDARDLCLSPGKQRELDAYMTAFTRPLILQVYGEGDEIGGLNDVVALFRAHDTARARQKLGLLAKKLGVSLGEIPVFLQDYGETYLSVSYFRQCADQLRPVSTGLKASLGELARHRQLGQDREFVAACNRLVRVVAQVENVVEQRFRLFDEGTRSMWSAVSAENFYAVKQMILSNHAQLGGLLCGLSACLDGWSERFPNADAGGPHRRAEYIRNELRFAVENLRAIRQPAAVEPGL
ncbi:MAG: hypothetical protein RID42_03330 [Alphaproteobacteria bacterium]